MIFAIGLRAGSEAELNRGKAMNALKGAQAASLAAARQKSNDASAAMSGSSFDGRSGGNAVSGGGSAATSGGVYGRLDASPINLKAKDTDLNEMKIEAPPTVAGVPEVDQNEEMRKMVMKMVIMAAIGGIMGGITGVISL